MQRWPITILKVLALLTGFIFIAYISIAVYVNFNKQKLLVSVNDELNRSLNGSIQIGSMEPSFFLGFPGVSMSLKNVVLRDSLWRVHRHTLLEAKSLDVSVNAIALITGTIRINRIGINDARVYLFTDSSGYSNTSIFRKRGKKKGQDDKGGAAAEINRFSFRNVGFILDNRKGNKLFRFSVNDLKGRIKHGLSGWKARLDMRTIVNDLAFNTKKGSFLKNKQILGSFSMNYKDDTGIIEVEKKEITIGDDQFVLGARFSTVKEPVDFVISLASDKLIWKNASALLSQNITEKLNMFDLTDPISVNAVIAGNLGKGSQPSIDVSCKVKNNTLNSPGGIVDQCSFNGFFTNHYVKGRGNKDPNSMIKLFQFKGNYEKIPLTIDTAYIYNLVNPVATGTFRSKFPIKDLNPVLGEDLLRFNNGVADVNVKYRASVADFQLRKPLITGTINIENADLDYVPRKLNFKNSSIALNFTKDDLSIKNIRIQSGSSIVNMQGFVKNFMNLYYIAPEKIQFKWDISSPRINLSEFLGFFAVRRFQSRGKQKHSDFMGQLNVVLDRSRVNMNMHVDKVIYDKFVASNANASISMGPAGIELNNISLKHGGGTLSMTGKVLQQDAVNRFTVNTRISNVSIRKFFYSFNNFGQKSFTHENLRGYLFSRSRISGSITDQGKVIPRSFNGFVVFDLRKGALLSFDPIKKVGKFAFPFRDLDNITFSNLNGKFDIRGEKIKINPMKISSSVLNMDVAGVYSLGKGTNIALDVPLRNPKKDEDITDKKKINERRMKGIVLHILATDGEDGGIKFKWNKDHD